MSRYPSNKYIFNIIRPVYIAAYGILQNQADAEDVAHDVFLNYFQVEDKKRIRDLENYLLKMARNRALDYLKRKKTGNPFGGIAGYSRAVTCGL